MEFENKKVSHVDIVFENTELYTIPIDCIDRLYIEDLKKSLDIHYNGYSYALEKGELMEYITCTFFQMVINDKGMNIIGDTNWTPPQPLKERIKSYDITHLDVYFTDNTHVYIGIPWESSNDDEYTNEWLQIDVKPKMIFICGQENGCGEDTQKDFNEYYDFEINSHEPEIGHMMFGNNKMFEYDVPNYVYAALQLIKDKLNTVMWNINQTEYDSPFENSGISFKCDIFEVQAYDWNDESFQEYNFKWKDYKISWYKYLGRDMSANMKISPSECAIMLEECLDALKELDKEE